MRCQQRYLPQRHRKHRGKNLSFLNFLASKGQPIHFAPATKPPNALFPIPVLFLPFPDEFSTPSAKPWLPVSKPALWPALCIKGLFPLPLLDFSCLGNLLNPSIGLFQGLFFEGQFGMRQWVGVQLFQIQKIRGKGDRSRVVEDRSEGVFPGKPGRWSVATNPLFPAGLGLVVG